MSNYLTGLAQLNPQVKRHNGGTATLTLDENGTTNATLLFVNGVAQTPGIDFNVSGATLTTTSTLPAGTNIATTIQYFNTGVVNTVADDAIGLGQMASGTDGNLITYDASGNPAHVATGNDGQVLTSAGAGSPPAFEDAGGNNILEALHMVCDGSTTVVSSGSYASTNITGSQNSTTSYADLSGSSINYTPPSGTKTVLYEFRYATGYINAQEGTHHKIFLDGTEVTNARFSSTTQGGLGDNNIYVRWVFKIGDGAVAATGKVSSWSSAKIIKVQIRAFSGTYTTKIHETVYWDGGGGTHLSKPTLSVTALS